MSEFETLANLPYKQGYLPADAVTMLKRQFLFGRAVQAYLWALPALNMYGMKEGCEQAFGKGYNVLLIFKKRLDARTLITTPNSDVIYAMGYLDLKHSSGALLVRHRVRSDHRLRTRQRPAVPVPQLDGQARPECRRLR
jgi:hypothetical protein